MPKTSNSLVIGAVLALGLAGQAAAADHGEGCCLDLEARVAELEAMAARKGDRKVSLTVSGLITWPIMVWDDGGERGAFVVSNEVKRPRFRFAGEAKFDPKWSAAYVLEVGPNPSPTAPMDQFGYVSSAEHTEVRYSFLALKNADFGQIALGLQSQATDLATEVTLANTTSVMSPGLPILLGYVTRGWFMRKADGTLSGLRFGDILFRGRNDSWGEGHRWSVARYDSPVFAGFSLSASWGEDDVKDAAVRYSGDIGRFKFAAAAGIAAWSDSSGQRGCARVAASPDVDCWEAGGSASLMDPETGLFLNAAAGYGKDKNVGALYANAAGIDDDETFYYFVAGIERPWLTLGKTTLFAQYWHRNIGAGVFFNGARLDATGLGALPFVSSADVTIWGASLVQSLGDGIDLYFSLNRTETEVRTSTSGGAPGSVTTKIEPFDFLLAGMAMRF